MRLRLSADGSQLLALLGDQNGRTELVALDGNGTKVSSTPLSWITTGGHFLSQVESTDTGTLALGCNQGPTQLSSAGSTVDVPGLGAVLVATDGTGKVSWVRQLADQCAIEFAMVADGQLARSITDKQPRVLGPYRRGSRWMVVSFDTAGKRHDRSFGSRAEAEAYALRLKKDLAVDYDRSIADALEAYERYLTDEKQNKPRSVATTMHRLRAFFGDGSLPLRKLDLARGVALYDRLRSTLAVDTHCNMLAEAKTFLGWCERKKWIDSHPAPGWRSTTGASRRGRMADSSPGPVSRPTTSSRL